MSYCITILCYESAILLGKIGLLIIAKIRKIVSQVVLKPTLGYFTRNSSFFHSKPAKYEPLQNSFESYQGVIHKPCGQGRGRGGGGDSQMSVLLHKNYLVKWSTKNCPHGLFMNDI